MKVKFTKAWRHFKPGDTLVLDDKNGKVLVDVQKVAKKVASKKKPA